MSVEIQQRKLSEILKNVRGTDWTPHRGASKHPRTPPHRDEKLLIEMEKRYFGKLSFRGDTALHAEAFKIINVANNEELRASTPSLTNQRLLSARPSTRGRGGEALPRKWLRPSCAKYVEQNTSGDKMPPLKHVRRCGEDKTPAREAIRHGADKAKRDTDAAFAGRICEAVSAQRSGP